MQKYLGKYVGTMRSSQRRELQVKSLYGSFPEKKWARKMGQEVTLGIELFEKCGQDLGIGAVPRCLVPGPGVIRRGDSGLEYKRRWLEGWALDGLVCISKEISWASWSSLGQVGAVPPRSAKP